MHFPPLKVRDLEGTERVIPHGLPGGPHIIMLAFKQRHQLIVNAWKPGLEQIATRHPGTQVWEVPSISRGYRLFRSSIDGGMRAGIPDPETREHTLTAYTDLDALKTALDIESLETVHVFLVDCSGTVLWHSSGDPSDSLLAALEDAVPESC